MRWRPGPSVKYNNLHLFSYNSAAVASSLRSSARLRARSLHSQRPTPQEAQSTYLIRLYLRCLIIAAVVVGGCSSNPASSSYNSGGGIDSSAVAAAVTAATRRLTEHGSNGLSVNDVKRTRDWFTPQLYDLLVKDMTGPDEIGYLDWDPFTGAQDDVGAFSFAGARNSGDTVKVRFTYLQRRDTVIIAMQRMSGSWRIANFFYPNWESCHRDLAAGLARWAKYVAKKRRVSDDRCVE